MTSMSTTPIQLPNQPNTSSWVTRSSLTPWSAQLASSEDVARHDLQDLVLRVLELHRPASLGKVSQALRQVDSRHLAVWLQALDSRARLLLDLQEMLEVELIARRDELVDEVDSSS